MYDSDMHVRHVGSAPWCEITQQHIHPGRAAMRLNNFNWEYLGTKIQTSFRLTWKVPSNRSEALREASSLVDSCPASSTLTRDSSAASASMSPMADLCRSRSASRA